MSSRVVESDDEEDIRLIELKENNDTNLHHEGTKPLSVSRILFFFLLVLIFILPLLKALAHEGLYHRGTRPRYLPSESSVTAVVVWCLFSYILYSFQRQIAFSFAWKMHEKDSACHKEDIFRMTLYNIFLCVAGRVGARIDEGAIFFLSFCGVATIFFGVLFEMVKVFNIEFTKQCIRNPYALFFASFLIFILGSITVNHLSLIAATAQAPDTELNLFEAFALIAAVLMFHIGLSFAPGNSSAHWHHWYGGFLGSLFCVFDTFSSRIAQAMLIGIYFHGAALFGVEPCFTPDTIHEASLEHQHQRRTKIASSSETAK
uniref:Uncharacterized protein n=1 Tax=Aureoumbra lagunensis TaxID=44058 RepID=A0A7S3JVH7_9STRA